MLLPPLVIGLWQFLAQRHLVYFYPNGPHGSVAYVLDPVGDRFSDSSDNYGVNSGTFGYNADDELSTEDFTTAGGPGLESTSLTVPRICRRFGGCGQVAHSTRFVESGVLRAMLSLMPWELQHSRNPGRATLSPSVVIGRSGT